MYSENCLQKNQGIKKPAFRVKVFNPEHPKFKYLYETEPVATEKGILAPRGSVIGFIVMIYNFDVAPDCNVNRPIKFVISNVKAR